MSKRRKPSALQLWVWIQPLCVLIPSSTNSLNVSPSLCSSICKQRYYSLCFSAVYSSFDSAVRVCKKGCGKSVQFPVCPPTSSAPTYAANRLPLIMFHPLPGTNPPEQGQPRCREVPSLRVKVPSLPGALTTSGRGVHLVEAVPWPSLAVIMNRCVPLSCLGKFLTLPIGQVRFVSSRALHEAWKWLEVVRSYLGWLPFLQRFLTRSDF